MRPESAEGAPAGGLPWAVRHRRVVVLLAALAAVAAGWFGGSAHDSLSAGEVVPYGAEALRANEVLEREFGAATPNLVLVTRAAGPVDGPGPSSAAGRLTRLLEADPAVTRVRSYWSTRSPALRSHDGRGALVLVRLRGREEQATRAAGRLVPRVTGDRGALTVTATGEAAVRAAVVEQSERDQLRGELLALPLTALLLLVVFRSAVAALLPVVVGALAVLGTLALLRLLTAVTAVSVYASSICSALGFALAVDYSLFLITRYREQLARGDEAGPALRTALRTAGRAVAFSAGTVGLSMSALLVFPHTILRSIAYGGIVVVVLAAAGSLLLLPALLWVLGDRVERFDVLARWRRVRPGPDAPGAAPPLGGWGRTAVRVMRRPLVTTLVVGAGLALVAAPFTGVRFGLFDDRVLPASSAVGEARTVLSKGFDANAVVSPTTVVLPRFDARAEPGALDDFARRIAGLHGVRRVDTSTGGYERGVRVRPPTAASASFASDKGAWLAVTTRGEPNSQATRDLARGLRELPAPAPVLVGGPGATLADVQRSLADRLPLALSLVAGAMLGLVLVMTRRPVLAVKALVLNALSLSATFGALVHVFQEGHLAGVLGGFTATGTTDALLPVLVFCIAFGLSMDYEIFLLARICEEHRRTGDTMMAVAHGLDRTARLFTWAALTIAVVMAALATSDLVLLKIVGVGLALAVLLDATVVRGLLVPAVMRLAGRANWWTPTRKGSLPVLSTPLPPAGHSGTAPARLPGTDMKENTPR
ncbi:MMPL family transporter [Streptomyces sp. ISL-11]|uniref:MMPL family transporter n=1 Tax=Streptomyces sp. ISL-11 TaxID=2819174 RepID=UPI001BEB9CAA|nr:MMPL family transporter [Streptomyces sp. ISL-11]MBT2383308.1 MMPL family transporter [Streptomyces sp. ISL-11]